MGVVQAKADASVTSLTFASSTTTGNKILVFVAVYDNTGLDIGTTDVTDNKSNTYTRRLVVDNSSNTLNMAIFESQDSPTMGASHQITFATHQDQSLAILEVSGLASGGSFDKSGSVGPVVSTNTIVTSSTGTLTQADELVVAMCSTDQGNTDTITQNAGQSWTLIDESERGDIELAFNAVYKTVAATTALTADWALGGSHERIGIIGTFKLAAAAAFVAPPPIVISQAVKTASYW